MQSLSCWKASVLVHVRDNSNFYRKILTQKKKKKAKNGRTHLHLLILCNLSRFLLFNEVKYFWKLAFHLTFMSLICLIMSYNLKVWKSWEFFIGPCVVFPAR
uniref:Uncharacterized protein n=1 Tax=Mus musculus TaxID=10090 RepID=Q8C2V4_MOUSE|nr:unnamed protein product [Mus musculus]